jgi:large subunit ribosomal protein L18
MSTSQAQAKKQRRLVRIKATLKAAANGRPRLAVFRSLAHISAQVIDDATGKTLAAAHDRDLKDMAGKKKAELAFAVGKFVVERAKAKGVEAVVFDRRDKKYHGRVRALAEGAREAGLQF